MRPKKGAHRCTKGGTSFSWPLFLSVPEKDGNQIRDTQAGTCGPWASAVVASLASVIPSHVSVETLLVMP
jgi:hypothetical protein